MWQQISFAPLWQQYRWQVRSLIRSFVHSLRWQFIIIQMQLQFIVNHLLLLSGCFFVITTSIAAASLCVLLSLCFFVYCNNICCIALQALIANYANNNYWECIYGCLYILVYVFTYGKILLLLPFCRHETQFA